ncbi:hypothetical protein KX729_06720 [Rhizobium sp. XQZ8]|uniref:hypothetical protein n=1 Tax=Rhizobium populisoli TaxID=2859785 RepID=UPI001CA4FBDF|nr:hypothetical protein [Rhizobium populisoli]MBW6421131.1 hypothetical protein [Rhizobium populisoli]
MDAAGVIDIFFSKMTIPMAVMTMIVAIACFGFSFKKFTTLAWQPGMSKVPIGARYWTTYYNYYVSGIIYASISIILFILLIFSPELLDYILKIISGKLNLGELSIPTQGFPDVARPIVALSVIFVLFGSRKSPFHGVEEGLRGFLQDCASIPTKVRSVVNSMVKATFDPSRKSQLAGAAAEFMSDASMDEWPEHVKGKSFDDKLYKILAVKAEIDKWSSTMSELNALHKECAEEFGRLDADMRSLFLQIENYIDLIKNNAEKHDIDEMERDILLYLDNMESRVYLPIAWKLFIGSRFISRRRQILEKVGFLDLPMTKPRVVLKSMQEDIYQISAGLLFVIYPVGIFIASAFLHWKPDNKWWDVLLIWPMQFVIFFLSILVPAIWIADRIHKDNKNRFLGYLIAAPFGFFGSILSIAATRGIADGVISASTGQGLASAIVSAGAVAPFGFCAAIVTVTLSVLSDIPRNFIGRSLLDGLITAIAAVFSVVLAFGFAQEIDRPLWDLLWPDQALIQQLPTLRPLQMIVPLISFAGFALGLYVPSAFRRYRQGLSSSTSTAPKPVSPPRSVEVALP